VHAELGPAISEAIDRSQEGGLPAGWSLRQRRRSRRKHRTAADLLRPAISRFVRHGADGINREPENAGVERTPTRSRWSPATRGAAS